MKKTQLLQKPALILSATLVLFSCVQETESPLMQENANRLEVLNTPPGGEENLRKTADRNYSERFTNQLFQLDENGVPTDNILAYYPGTGDGNSTHMGKALTFINQRAVLVENGLATVAEPVTKFFSKELAALGLTDIPEEVSSITTDGKGNSVWFKSISNQVTFSETEPRADFKAVVEIIGGTGKFEKATGDGEVTGFFNPTNGEGSSVIRGRIVY
jgi:hypothetical protein